MTTADQSGAIGFEPGRALNSHLANRHFPAVGGVLKRTFDISAASFILLMMSPLILFTAAAIRIGTRGPVFYGHERIGLGGRRFRCWKFRTMCTNAEEVLRHHLEANASARAEWRAQRKLRNDPRVTRLGRVLREYSVDELPQLINVLRGDMSLVGPRPVVEDELAYYGQEALEYCSARPGVTGLWQVSGRSDTDYARRVELDAHYVRTWSIRSDMMILLRTIPAVLGARGSC